MGWGEVIGGPKVWARDLGLAVAVGIAIAFVGPFGSYGAPLEQRILISVSYGLTGSVVLWPLVRLVRKLAGDLGLAEWFGIVAALVVGAMPVTLTSRVVGAVFDPHHVQADLVVRYFGVLAIVFPVGLVVLLYDRRSAPPATPQAEPPRLLGRLPPHLGTDIQALQAEDHYVRVHTAKASALLLMRFADAVAELDGLEGLRVHRSWWVAKGAVAAARAEGRRAVLTLTGGVEVPVTRETVPQIRRAGWL